MSKILTGKVVSNKMEKTVVVAVERKYRHKKYRKVIVRHKKYKVHNPEMKLNIGDVVTIEETRPISKDKHFIVVKEISNGKTQISKPKLKS